MHSRSSKSGSIYTLAQKRTEDFLFMLENKAISGNGTNITNNPALLKRANKKVISNALIMALIDVAKANEEFELVQPYWNTFHCQNELTGHDEKVFGKYCKNRWCATCCGIRKADILNRYYPILAKWEEPHLLTLTAKTVKAEHLEKRIEEYIKKFDRIRDRCNKRHLRKNGMKIKGVKSLECNYNASKKWYNPHYHIIVPNRPTAIYIKQEWRKEWNKNGIFEAGENAQNIRKIENVEDGLIEVIKYGAKMLSDPDPEDKRKRKKGDINGLHIYANALHTIYKAMSGHRLYGSFGFRLNNCTEYKAKVRLVKNYETWKYQLETMDWVNTISGKRLTEYEIDTQLDTLLKSSIDLELC